ncbi:MAG: glycosyl transferase family protein, partial [bacterium]|nr:glycosyl transferase family protein [bacterium]
MDESIFNLIDWADALVAFSLLPLAVWILLSGLDDLFVLAVYLRTRIQPPPVSGDPRERAIAIFVPCWNEHAVISDMVEHNISAIRYPRYSFFIGAYPNDEPTIDAIRQLEERHPNVHLCLCPHEGPTSKADCLNWIYQRMLLYEDEHDGHFDIILTHDAEDIIHPESLREVDRYAGDFDFVQIPVLPLKTHLGNLTHGLYCDDFAECHTKDLPVRQSLGGFIPSSGVGTGYTREALELLATRESNRIFEPSCLTEDYENGFRLHAAGCRQLFLPIRFVAGSPMATREFFPQSFAMAVRQRTRWMTGIACQTWERHGWSGGWKQVYWLWRDRKSVIGYPVSLLSNLLFAYGGATGIAAAATGSEWGLAQHLHSPALLGLLGATLALQLIHLAVRTACSARVYGWRFALGVPVRLAWGNALNTAATTAALSRYALARIRHEPLVWVKTEHAYPSRVALLPYKRPIEEILVGSAYLTPDELELARRGKPRGVRLAEHLVHTGMLSEEELYEALSLQLGLALGEIHP